MRCEMERSCPAAIDVTTCQPRQPGSHVEACLPPPFGFAISSFHTHATVAVDVQARYSLQLVDERPHHPRRSAEAGQQRPRLPLRKGTGRHHTHVNVAVDILARRLFQHVDDWPVSGETCQKGTGPVAWGNLAGDSGAAQHAGTGKALINSAV
eukprot:4755905-Prymnesium_polylepis.1